MPEHRQPDDPKAGDVDVRDAPELADPDDPRKPESPTDLTKPSLMFVLKKTAREFGRDQCTDLAAALTYYSVLSLFPALLALVSLLGVFGQGEKTVDAVMQMIDELGPSSAVDTLRGPVEQLVDAPSAGLALVLGLAGALWSASGYVGAAPSASPAVDGPPRSGEQGHRLRTLQDRTEVAVPQGHRLV